ncbi:reverse transcriptase domain-containing protein [Tanacetum coccineum]
MDPNYPVFANTLETYDAYFQDDRERYIRSYQEYEQYMALCEQEAGGSGSGTGSRSSPKKRAYIPRQRETAEERLIDDYFGDEEIDPKYTEENFRRRSVADQRLWIWHAYFGVPGANNDLNVLYGSPLFDDELAGTALECPFEVNGHIYNKGYYLADGIYPIWSLGNYTTRNPGMFQEMLQQQYELERKMKQDVLERESRARVDLLESQKIAEDMRVLTMDTSSLDPMNAAIVKAQQARIRAKYPTQE